MKIKQRRKVYSIAIPIFLVVTLILGSAAYVGGELYRQSYWNAGAQVGYQYGAQIGYITGAQAGFFYGQQQGYYYGKIDGKLETYYQTIVDMENPYHLAVLEFEKKHLDADIAHMCVLPMSDRGGKDGIVVLLATPLMVNGETGKIDGRTLDQLPADMTQDLVRMVKTVYRSEPYVKIVLLGTLNAYDPYHYYAYDRVTYEIQDFWAQRWDQGLRTTDDLKVAELYPNIQYVKGASAWALNPYYIQRLSQQQESGTGAK